MKNLRFFKSILMIIIISILTGCSDSITSSGRSDYGNSNSSLELTGEDHINRNSFSTRFKLKPKGTHTFTSDNTGLKRFTSVQVERIYPASKNDYDKDPCKDIEVYTENSDDFLLSCKTFDINYSEITVLNSGSTVIEVNVILNGMFSGQ